MLTYNGVYVPHQVETMSLVSAFHNILDEKKLADYTKVIEENDLLRFDFPAIKGFPHVIDENDIGKVFLSGEEIEENHLGVSAWFVTDGHHRSLAFLENNIKYIHVTLDRTAITSEIDLHNYDKEMEC